MPESTTIQGLEQSRARFAFQCAEKASKSGKPKKYKSYAKKFPMMIKTNGLGSALAFAFSKKKQGNNWERLYNDVSSWIKQPQKIYLLGNFSNKEIAQAAIELDSQSYRCLTIEVLAFLTWLRRFAEGLIEGEDEGESEEN